MGRWTAGPVTQVLSQAARGGLVRRAGRACAGHIGRPGCSADHAGVPLIVKRVTFRPAGPSEYLLPPYEPVRVDVPFLRLDDVDLVELVDQLPKPHAFGLAQRWHLLGRLTAKYQTLSSIFFARVKRLSGLRIAWSWLADCVNVKIRPLGG